MSLKKSEKYSIISKKETKIMEKFFTDCFSNMPQEEIENYHRAVFMNMEGAIQQRNGLSTTEKN